MHDKMFKIVTFGCASLLALLALGFFVQLGLEGCPALKSLGLGFLVSTEWNPSSGQYGALPALLGTLATTLIAIVLAVPLAFAAALFVVDAPPRIGCPLAQALDILAAIPSVIYGIWGLFVLCPTTGFNLLTASLVLTLMILPYISAVMRDVIAMMPSVLKEAAYGLGCTRLETVKDVIIRYGKNGLAGAIFVGLGRALGETMAVMFVAGGIMKVPSGLTDGCCTIASLLANDFAEAGGVHQSVLFVMAFLLLALSFVIQIIAQSYLRKGKTL